MEALLFFFFWQIAAVSETNAEEAFLVSRIERFAATVNGGGYFPGFALRA